MSTPRLEFAELTEGQAKKHLSINENSYKLDVLVQTSVVDRNLTAPPGSPTEGDIYIPAATATDEWETHENELAQYRNAAWVFVEPQAGYIAWVQDEEILIYWDGSAWQSGDPTAASLAGLSDVDLDTPVNGEALVYNGGVWENGTVSTVGVLNDLDDVDITLQAKGDILVSDGTNFIDVAAGANGQVLTVDGTQATGVKWADAAVSGAQYLYELGDVDITGGPAAGKLLVYDGSDWVDIGVGTNGQVLTADDNYTNGVVWADSAGGAMDLVDLDDVDIGTPTNGYFVKWSDTANGGLGGWVDAPASVDSLEDIDDVFYNGTPSDKQVLMWDDAVGEKRWENKNLSLDDLHDVNVASAGEGKILKYSSGTWVAGDPSSGAVAALADITDVEDNPDLFEGVPYYNRWSTSTVKWKHDIQLPKFIGRLRDVETPSNYGDTNRPVAGVEGLVSDYVAPSGTSSQTLYYRRVVNEGGYAYGFETNNTTGGYSTTTYIGHLIEELPKTGTQWYDNIGSGSTDLTERFMISITGTGAGSYWVRRVWWYEYDPSGHPDVYRCFFEIDNDDFGGNPIPALSFDTSKSVSFLGEESKLLKWHPYDMTAVPSTTTSTGRAGQIAFNTSYLYVCVADNTWKRIAWGSW